MANTIPIALRPADDWLDRLTPVGDIDPGEAQLFAAAADAGLLIMSGDKRALRALKDMNGFAGALAGRIIVIEAILLGLCALLGADTVRQRIHTIAAEDAMIGICFSTSNPDPTGCLRSYYNALTHELWPLSLWNPVRRL